MKQEQRHAQTRKRIIGAAQAEFIQKGFQNANINRIAKSAELSKVTLYKYFPTKKDLANTVVRQLITEGYASFGTLIQDTDPKNFSEVLHQIIGSSRQLSSEIHPDFSYYILQDLQGKTGELESRKAYMDGKRNFWKQFISIGREGGQINPEISDASLMSFLDMFLEYYFNHEFIVHDSLTTPNFQEISELFFYGFFSYAKSDTNRVGSDLIKKRSHNTK